MGIIVKHSQVSGAAAPVDPGRIGGPAWDGDHQIILTGALKALASLAGSAGTIFRFTGGESAEQVALSDAAASLLSLASLPLILAALGGAPLNNPALTGVPTAPTAAPGTATSQVANTAFVQAALDALAGGAPGLLDTLGEISAALNDDPDFAGTMLAALAAKAPVNDAALTGTPTAPTVAGTADSSTKIATTAFVQAVRALLAPLNSPALTGTPTAPTVAGSSDNTTKIATTAFVQAVAAANLFVAASVAEQKAGSATNVGVTPGRQQHHPSAVKAWAHCTVSGGVLTVVDSFGLTSIARSGTGTFVITFATPFLDANGYSIVGMARNTTNELIEESSGSRSTSAVTVLCIKRSDGLLSDPNGFSIQVCGRT